MNKVKLYEGAEKKSYYKFFNVPLVTLNEEESNKYLHTQVDNSDAVTFADRAILQKPEYVPEREGYRILDDGTISITSIIETPNLTGENMDWFMIWHQLDPLRYAIWNPQDHYGVSISDKDRARMLDESIPLPQRIWNTTSNVKESMNGDEPCDISIGFRNPEDCGYDNSLIGTDSCQAMVVASNEMKAGPIKIPVFLTESVRTIRDGKSAWVAHWWLGHGIDENGKEIYMKIPLPLRKMVAQKAATLIVHNHNEVGHLNEIMPELYRENKDNWLE